MRGAVSTGLGHCLWKRNWICSGSLCSCMPKSVFRLLGNSLARCDHSLHSILHNLVFWNPPRGYRFSYNICEGCLGTTRHEYWYENFSSPQTFLTKSWAHHKQSREQIYGSHKYKLRCWFCLFFACRWWLFLEALVLPSFTCGAHDGMAALNSTTRTTEMKVLIHKFFISYPSTFANYCILCLKRYNFCPSLCILM